MIDGNMKNRRDVCKAKDAGCIEFFGLPGIFQLQIIMSQTACTSLLFTSSIISLPT